MTARPGLRRIDRRPIPDRPAEIYACLVVRNERLRLPSTLAHYRAIGVDRFVIVDNGSDDGTLEWLEAEPDVHLFATGDSFLASMFGRTWVNSVLGALAQGRWVVVVDADEQLVYPRWEAVRLGGLCRYLDGCGARAMFCLMLDMYSDASLERTTLAPGGSLIETCPYFDRSPYRLVRGAAFPGGHIYGGVRERLFRDRLGGRYHPPLLNKIPLVKWGADVRWLTAHTTTSVPLADIAGALLHFKFLSDFHARAATETARGEHYEDASEYRAYLELVEGGLTSLMSPVSTRYEDSAQLVALNVMRTSEAYERFASEAVGG
jgi:hypothetical protein